MNEIKFPKLDFIKMRQDGSIAQIILANPKKANAVNRQMWFELGEAARILKEEKEKLKVVILSAEGKHFCAGIHLDFLKEIFSDCKNLPKEQRPQQLKIKIQSMQKAFHSFYELPQPVIAAVHGACIGAGFDLISACDIRIGTLTSVFCIAETKLGIVADIGTLQHAPYFFPEGRLRELSFTSEPFRGLTAIRWGLLNHLAPTKGLLLKKAFKIANRIVSLPGYAVFGTKTILNHNRIDRIVSNLEKVAEFNSHLLCSEAAEKYFSQIL